MRRMNLVQKMAAITAASLIATTIAPVSAFAYGEVNVGGSTFKEDTDNDNDYREWRSTVWDTGARADSGKIALTPGADERDLNFAWYSVSKGTPAVKVYEYGKQSAAKVFVGSATTISAENWQGSTYAASNKVSIEDYFEENKEYRYVYTDNYVENGTTVWSVEYTYTTGDASEFSVILTGDPQIGASGASNDNSITDDSVARDTYNWNITMQQAMATCPDAVLLLSAGDQINQTNATLENDLKTRESEYAGYLYSSVFRSLPIASTIGNHDMNGIDYTYHFNNPNSEDNLGATAAGGDYYFSYGEVLFISLNSNNRNQEEHRTLMTEALKSNPDAIWKVVIFHSDIYGSGQPHADTDAATNRVIFAPLMDEFDIDICLTGHDHTYSRSYQILDGNVIEYDDSSSFVTDPEGTLYITTGSGSGSKYYNLLNYTPYYIAERTNKCLPAFSTIDFSEDSLTICTYDYTGTKYADDFTINKTSANESAAETLEKAQKLDTSNYTEESVKKLTTAVTTLKNLIDSYTTAEDKALAIFVEGYGTDGDVVKGYGSVVNNADKDTQYNGGGSAANRFKLGYSTLLDKTIYTQLANSELPIVAATTITAAQKSVNDAITALEVKSTTEKDESDVGAGSKNIAPWVIASLGIVFIAGATTVAASRKERDCEEE